MQHHKFIALAASLTALIVIITIGFADVIWNAEAYAQYSFAVSALITLLVAVLLGYYFWHLQKKDADKIEKLVTRIDSYIEQQRQIQDSIRQASLKVIQRQLQSAMRNLLYLIGYFETYTQKDPSERVKLLDDWVKRLRLELHADAIDLHLSQVTPYIHRDLADKISAVSSDFRMLNFSVDDKNENRLLNVDKPETVDRWMRNAKDVFHAIREIDKSIEDYRASEDKPAS